jgi:hypothetical protein
MQALSRELNPECEHVLGDMRSLRLERQFDAVLAHDAIGYMTTLDDLRAAMTTAFVHTRPGGAALFTPDCILNSFREYSLLHENAEPNRSLRCLEYCWDPDPDDGTFTVDFAFLLRDASEVRAVHDRHVEGLFPRDAWLSLLEEVGFRARAVVRPFEDGGCDEVFLASRPL